MSHIRLHCPLGTSFLLVISAALCIQTGALAAGTCVPDADTLCLQSDRISVEVDWDDTVSSGTGQVLGIGTDDTGFFSYQDPLYAETMVRVLDACSFNEFFWVFAAGLSDAIQTITVTDEIIGTVWTYDNFLGDFPTFNDITAIPCQPPFTSHIVGPHSSARSERLSLPARPTRAPEGTPSTTLHLLEGRFQVEVDWEDFEMNTGDGIPEPISDVSGVFWFFAPDAYELLLKIVDNASTTGFFSLFFASTSNVEYTVQVTDVCTGSVQTYNSPLGASIDTTVDLAAFAATSTCAIFRDGFESGDVTEWGFSLP